MSRALSAYEQLWWGKIQANNMNIFLKKMMPAQEKPQAGPSGGIPEGLNIIGDDGLMSVIVPEHRLVGQDA